MQRGVRFAATVFSLIMLFVACNDRIPSAPSSIPISTTVGTVPPPRVPAVTGQVSIWSGDILTAAAGAKVEVIRGADIGVAAITDARGWFYLQSLSIGKISLKASYQGFESEVTNFDLTGAGHGEHFVLVPPGTSSEVIRAGDAINSVLIGNEAPCSGSGDPLFLEGGATGPCKRFTLIVPQSGRVVARLEWQNRNHYFDVTISGQTQHYYGPPPMVLRVGVEAGQLQVGVAIHGSPAGPQPFTLTTSVEP